MALGAFGVGVSDLASKLTALVFCGGGVKDLPSAADGVTCLVGDKGLSKPAVDTILPNCWSSLDPCSAKPPRGTTGAATVCVIEGSSPDCQRTDCALPNTIEVAPAGAVVERVGAGGTGERETDCDQDASLAILTCCCGCTCDAKGFRTCGCTGDAVSALLAVKSSSFRWAAENAVLPVFGKEGYTPPSVVMDSRKFGVDAVAFDVESGGAVEGALRL